MLKMVIGFHAMLQMVPSGVAKGYGWTHAPAAGPATARLLRGCAEATPATADCEDSAAAGDSCQSDTRVTAVKDGTSSKHISRLEEDETRRSFGDDMPSTRTAEHGRLLGRLDAGTGDSHRRQDSEEDIVKARRLVSFLGIT